MCLVERESRSAGILKDRMLPFLDALFGLGWLIAPQARLERYAVVGRYRTVDSLALVRISKDRNSNS